MNENFNYCHVVGKTDVGRKRAANEDNMYNAITQNGLVSVVCDGMGGHVGGATASKIAVSTIIENLNDVFYDDPRIAIGESIDRANRAIIQRATEQPELAGMGSTCVLLLVRNGKVYIGHVGDSRIYLIRSKRIVQLTKDHSYVQMLVDCGEITKEQAEHHPRKNEITNALGIPNMSPATVADDAIVPEAGDCFILCSDGLSGMISDDTICKVVSRQSEMNAQERVDKLVALANENGGVDNITVQLVEFSVSPNVVTDTDKKKFPLWAKITCAVSIIIALGVGAYFWWQEKQKTETDDNSTLTNTEQVVNSRSPHNLGSVNYKKNKKIIEFEFTDSISKFIIDNKVVYTETNVVFEPTSLVIKTEAEAITKTATSDNRKLWLSFTDKFPGETIEISLTTLDNTEVYNYSIDVKNVDSNGVLSIPKGTIPQQDSSKSEPKKTEIKAKVDTVHVQFEYDKLEKGARLLLNYSAKPTLIFNTKEVKKEVKVDSPKLEKILDGLSYDDLYWIKTPKNGQLLFEFNGENSDEQHLIVIPCAVKGSENQVLISVKIVPKQNKKDGDETPKGEKDNNERIKLQTA